MGLPVPVRDVRGRHLLAAIRSRAQSSGLFEFAAGITGARITGAGQGLAARPGHAGDFATGLLAVLVATPCTAPFMAVAIAGAFAAPPAVGMVVFLAMGLGLALPYAALAMLPGLAARLPRPGAWMTVLRQALAFPIFATCAWLAWVAAIEGGDAAVLGVAAGLVLLGLAGWLLGLAQRQPMRRPGFCAAGAAACALAALGLLPGLDASRPESAPGARQSVAKYWPPALPRPAMFPSLRRSSACTRRWTAAAAEPSPRLALMNANSPGASGSARSAAFSASRAASRAPRAASANFLRRSQAHEDQGCRQHCMMFG